MTRLLETPAFLRRKAQYGVWNDWTGAPATFPSENFNTVLTDSGTATVADVVKGILALAASDGTVADNDEAYLIGLKEVFKFAADKPLTFEALVQWTEANVDDANVIVGLMDAPGANSVLDNGAGPKASYSGAVFFKADGDTVWSVETSNAGIQVTTQLTAVNSLDKIAHTSGGAAYHALRIEFNSVTATEGEVDFFIGGVHVAKHAITLAALTEMALVAGIKNGNTNLETLNVDYIGADQLR
jgi:hypothetical protein